MAIISPRKADCVNNAGSESTSIQAFANTLTSSSYAVCDSAWCYQYDKYTDNFCYVPACSHTAGIMARTDRDRDAWFSPGYNRGQFLGITKLSFNPNQAERDALYKKRVNPVVTFPGKGLYYLETKLFLQMQVHLTELMLEDYSLSWRKQLVLQPNSNYLNLTMHLQELNLEQQLNLS